MKIVEKLGPKMGRIVMKTKTAAPDIAVIGGLALVIGGTGWFVKQSFTKGRVALDEYEEHKKAIPQIGEEIEHQPGQFVKTTETMYNRNVRKLRKDFAKELFKIYGPPLAMIIIGSGGVLYGRHLFKTRNIGLLASNAILQNKIDNVVKNVGEEKAFEYMNDIHEEEVEEEVELKNGNTKIKKTKKRVVNSPSPFAQFFGEGYSSIAFNDPTLNLMALKNVEDVCTRKLHRVGYVTLLDAYTEAQINIPKGSKALIEYCHNNGWSTAYGDDKVSLINWQNTDSNLVDFVNGYENVILLDPKVRPLFIGGEYIGY